MEEILNHERAACNHGFVLVQVPEDFNLERVVCNHGFFMMAPNRWVPSHKSLIRPLQLNNMNNNHYVTVCITQTTQSLLFIWVKEHNLSRNDQEAIKRQVSRMLRISERDDVMVKEFHSLHPQGKKSGFARMFRSPTLFEDIVKSLLLCNCRWSRSLKMAQALCDLQHKTAKKRKRCDKNECCWRFKCIGGNFPSPKEIARLDEESLNRSCNLGYRAPIILEIARSIENGSLDLGVFEYLDSSRDDKWIRQRLEKINGFGPFVVANIMMCLGFYQEIPVDTETTKHLEKVHGQTRLTIRRKTELKDVISQIYDKYAPFQCLVYWMEHVEYYEKALGKLSELPSSKYWNVSTTNLKTKN